MTNLCKKLLPLGISALILGSAAAQAEIKIALAGPVTGQVAQYGDMQFTGAEYAIKHINKSGGINGEKLKGVVYDDACDPKQATAVANKIVNDGIQLVVGHLCSSSTEPASDIYEDEGILMITAASTNPTITEKGYQLIFRTIGLDSQQGPFAAQWIINKIKPQRVAIVHDKQQYGEGLATAVQQTLTEADTNVVMFEGVTSGDKDFSSLISKLKKEKIDFVYYGGYHPELGLILRQSSDKGFKAQFMGPEGVSNKAIVAIAGKGAEGLLVTQPRQFDQDPKNMHYSDEIKANGGDPSGPFVFPAFSAVQVMADSIKAVGNVDTEKMAAYMRATTFSTPTGELEFDQKGDLKAFEFGIYKWHADGTSEAIQ